MKKRFVQLSLTVTFIVLLSSCGVYFSKDEPIGVWVCADPPMTFNFNECLPIGDIKCTIEIDGEEYTFKDILVPWHENILEMGTCGEIIEGTNGSEFTPELCLTYGFEGNKLWMSVSYSIYDDYPVGTRLEFEYKGEGEGIIKWP